jgi:hypothetical protein
MLFRFGSYFGRSYREDAASRPTLYLHFPGLGCIFQSPQF